MQFSALSQALSVSWVIFGIVILIAAIDTWRSGSSRAVALALALPLAYTLFSTLPAAFALGSLPTSGLTGATLFAALTAIAFIACYRIIGPFSPDDRSFPSAIAAGVASAVLLAVFCLQVASLHALMPVSGSFLTVFGEHLRWWWTLAGYAALVYVRM